MRAHYHVEITSGATPAATLISYSSIFPAGRIRFAADYGKHRLAQLPCPVARAWEWLVAGCFGVRREPAGPLPLLRYSGFPGAGRRIEPFRPEFRRLASRLTFARRQLSAASRVPMSLPRPEPPKPEYCLRCAALACCLLPSAMFRCPPSAPGSPFRRHISQVLLPAGG